MSYCDEAPASLLNAMKLVYNSDIVTVLVGPEQHKFSIHKDLLCNKSKYFAKAFSGSFLESETNTIKLGDVSVVLFKIFSYWLYYDQFAYIASDDGNIEDDFLTLKQDEQYEVVDEYEGEGEYDSEIVSGHDPTTWPSDVLIKLWLFGDRFDTQKLRNDIVPILNDMDDYPHEYLPSHALIRNVYDNTTKDCVLRKLIVDTVAHRGLFRGSTDAWQGLPYDFVVGVMVHMGMRRAQNQCRECYRNAREDNMLEDDVDLKHAPRRRDPCFYHDHADDEDRDACRTQGKKAA